MSYRYEEIIKSLDEAKIRKFLNSLDVHYREVDNAFIMPTICHNQDQHEASHKLYCYKDTNLFYCYTKCGGMSIFKFLEHFYKTRGIEYEWYYDIYDKIKRISEVSFSTGFVATQYESLDKRFKQNKKEIILPEYNQNVLDVFHKKYPVEWLNDNITKEAMNKFNIKYSISQNKIIIPHYDINERLIGIRGRALDIWEVENIGKYMPVQVEQLWYTHPLSLNLYGLNKTKENIKRNGYVYIVESEKAVMQLEGYCEENCGAAVCGSSLNKFQLDILMRECQPKEIILCFDKEELEGEDKYFYKLYNMCKKYNNYSNFSFVYDQDNLLKLKESPTDRGKEVFEELIRRRIPVK